MHAVFHYTGHRGNKPASVGTTLTSLTYNHHALSATSEFKTGASGSIELQQLQS